MTLDRSPEFCLTYRYQLETDHAPGDLSGGVRFGSRAII